MVRILLDAGADPAIPDADGRTALDHALSRGHGETAGCCAATDRQGLDEVVPVGMYDSGGPPERRAHRRTA